MYQFVDASEKASQKIKENGSNTSVSDCFACFNAGCWRMYCGFVSIR